MTHKHDSSTLLIMHLACTGLCQLALSFCLPSARQTDQLTVQLNSLAIAAPRHGNCSTRNTRLPTHLVGSVSRHFHSPCTARTPVPVRRVPQHACLHGHCGEGSWAQLVAAQQGQQQQQREGERSCERWRGGLCYWGRLVFVRKCWL